MGLLSTGKSLTWEEIELWAEYVKEHGIKQFINIFNSLKNRKNDLLKYGDEIEYCLVNFDHANKKVYVDLRASEALEILQEAEQNNEKYLESLWRMEYASYMVEGTPGKPFCCTISRLKLIETSMYLRKKELEEALSMIDPNLTSICISSFPRTGCPSFTYPQIDLSKTQNSVSESVFFPDAAIFNDHPRFANLTRNIRSRLGRKQRIYVPVWFDEFTQNPFYDPLPSHADSQAIESIKPNHIYMDCMGFGMGCSCLQVTIQAGNLYEARFLYDQLASIAPIMMILSACSPAWKGILSDWDCRWKVISMACDDRRDEERIETNERCIRKSRYDSIDMYLHPINQKYNDVPINYSEKHYEMLKQADVDDILSKHIAHLFCRDPISLFQEKLLIDDSIELDHFENLQSTNWQSCRFKPPPHNSTIGWRVEFRTLEVQFTCYENSLFVIFMVVLSRAMMKSNLNFVIPISLMEQNMERAIIRDAVNRSKFYFKTNYENTLEVIQDDIIEMTVDEIINGKVGKFIGLIPLIEQYLSHLELDNDTIECICEALSFIRDRSNGKLVTPATWIRNFVQQHPKYNHDSLISEEIMYDLTCCIKDISDGKIKCPELFGDRQINKVNASYIDAYRKMIQIESMNNTEIKLGLLQRKKFDKMKTLINLTRSEICEDLFRPYRQYTNSFWYHSIFGEIFQ